MYSPRFVSFLALLLLVSGCGGGEGGTTVTGQVTYKGAPVPMGVINFFSTAGGRPIGTALTPEGNYSLQLPAGDYKVVVLTSNPPVPAGWKEGDPLPQPPVKVPQKYALPETSPLAATVPEGRSFEQDFALE